MMRKLIRRFRRDEGATLPLVALLLVVLLGLTAFGVDLGWIYLNASRIQRAADAGALAGVIRMPTDFPQATTDAKAATKANTYEDGVDNAVVTVAQVTGEPNQLDVTVTDTVPTFFARVLGFETVTISRKARGEFVPPLKLGSPSNQFGNSCDPAQAGCSGQANFWANIHGEYTDTQMGDAYSSRCAKGAGSGSSGCTQNPIWRDRGYLYGVTANGAGSFTIEFNDLAFHNISGGQTTSDNIRTGDRGCEDWGNGNSSCGPTMYVALYAPDADPLDVSNNTLLCSQTVNPIPQVAPSASYGFSSPKSCFTVTNPQAGTYVVQVKMVSGSGDGLNRYAIRSSSGTSLFGLGDFSIYNNASGSTTEFYLAQVDQYYAGKTFVVELYDPGESSETGLLQVIDPGGGVFNSGNCRIYSRTSPTDNWALQSTPSNCQESVSPNEYNGRWLKFEMDVPSSYTCSNCWWKMNYAYPSAVNDTTTWRAYIVGNPIHLIPTS